MDQGSISQKKTFTREEVDRLIRHKFAHEVAELNAMYNAIRHETMPQLEDRKRAARTARDKAETLYHNPAMTIEELHTTIRGGDSLGFIEYTGDMEATFGIRLSADEVRTMTLRQLVESVENTLAQERRLAKLVSKSLDPDELRAQRTAESAGRGSRS